MLPNIVMRPLQQTDAAFLCSVFKDNEEYYHIFYDSEARVEAWEMRVARFLAQNVVKHYILQRGETLIGWLSFSAPTAKQRELDILVLDKAFLHQGYGAAGLSWFIEMCRAEAVDSITLNVNKQNTRAVRFYEAFGFQTIAEEIIPECNDAVDLVQYKMALKL